MTHKALYNQYRPQTFEEVVGQDAIVKTLKNALTKNKIAHAYLFCGPRGTGKTTMARLFAKALNCEEGQGQQCNICSNCTAITEGSHPDVIEIDAASNNGVEEVRNIVEKVKYLPIKGKYKVYIIDEVHMMSSGAFNALLKTLEEPPEHVVFILATTEPHKILPTIISRCQRYDFSKVEDSDITNRLVEILESENVNYEEEALRIIVELADGGVRDALSMLGQVLAYSENFVRTDDVLTLFAIASKQEKLELLKSLANHDIKSVLEKMDKFIDIGIDIKHLTSNLLEILRDLLVYQHGGEPYQLLSIREEDANELGRLISKQSCLQMIDVLLQAQIDFKNVANIRSLFEIVLLKLCSIEEQPVQIKEAVKEIVKEEQPVVTKIEEVIANTNKDPLKVAAENKLEEVKKAMDELASNIPEITEENDANEANLYHLSDETIIQIMVLATKDERIKLTDNWTRLKGMANHPKLAKIATALIDGRPCVVSKDVLLLEYELNTKVNKINNKELQDQYSMIVESLTGRKMFIYALSRSESIRLSKLFAELRQISKLPKPSTINLALPVELINKKEGE